jgi:urease accessory protein
VDGAARIEFARAQDGRTVLADLYQRAPCRVLFPTPDPGDPLQAVLLTTSGGLTGGDRTNVTIGTGRGACATVTTQAAERIYRASDARSEARIGLALRVGDGAWAECLAQETLLFDGARLRRTFTAEVAATGRLLALESAVFGRAAMGESFDTGLLHDAWQITRDGRLVWEDAVHLEGDIGRIRAEPFGFGTSIAYATLIYIGADAAAQLGTVREIVASVGGLNAATVIDPVLLVRGMSARPHELRDTMIRLVSALRRAAGAWPARLPRVWNC